MPSIPHLGPSPLRPDTSPVNRQTDTCKNCRAIKYNVMVFNTRGFILKKIQWHIHAGPWSLVNRWWECSYEALYKVLMNINESGCRP